MIPGFNHNLRYNFNHLIYTDDLILVSQASRGTTQNINLCLSIYGKLIGQIPNSSKSAVYFPSWFNKWVSKAIFSIFAFPATTFPITYLRILVSPKRLALAVFNTMIAKIQYLCSRWRHLHLSSAAKVVLINSSLLSVPTYYLSVYPIHDSTLHEIKKITRGFFWHKGGDRNGIHVVSWDDLTDSKPEGGLTIRNLLLAKQSLMAKDIFKYINGDDFIWADILDSKYGALNFWMDSIPACCSWFFEALCNVAFKLRSFFWLNFINPNQTSFLFDNWCFHVPLALNPTYLNMSLDWKAICISDFIANDN